MSKAAVLAVVGLLAMSAQAQPTLKVPSLAKGWKCLMTPTSFYAPGTIIELYPDGGVDRVVDLSQQIKISRGPAEVPVFEEQRTVSTGLILGLLKSVVKIGEASVSADASKTYSNAVQYAKVTEETTDFEAEAVVNEWVKQNPKAFERRKQGHRFLYVRDAYLAGELSYNVSDEIVAALGGEAQIKKAATLKVNLVNTAGGQGFRLNQTFSPPLRVCLKARPIGVLSAGAGGEQKLGVLPMDARLPDELQIRSP